MAKKRSKEATRHEPRRLADLVSKQVVAALADRAPGPRRVGTAGNGSDARLDGVGEPPEPASEVLVPLDAWSRILEQIGHLHQAGQELAEARERAGRAETEARFLRERLHELQERAPGAARNPADDATDPAPVLGRAGPEHAGGELPGRVRAANLAESVAEFSLPVAAPVPARLGELPQRRRPPMLRWPFRLRAG